MEKVVEAFGFDQNHCSVETIGNGLINHTWKLQANNDEFILQKVNHNVFKTPKDIAENIRRIGSYLAKKYPDYLFISSLGAKSGKNYFEDTDGFFYRLTPFVKQSKTITTVENSGQAFEAAKQFGKFSSLLSDFETEKLLITLPDFHNLSLRFVQFGEARNKATADRLELAVSCCNLAVEHQDIADQYSEITKDISIPKRVIHHDTKISNVLFDQYDRGICVIDLDTVMPGYFFSDLGDMMRTYLSEANEEEKDYSKIKVRTEFIEAILKGYCSEMADVLTAKEKQLFFYSGKFMIYMQAIRFLTDFLNNDIYYATTYPGQNLVRAGNQFTLLQRYIEKEKEFVEIAAAC